LFDCFVFLFLYYCIQTNSHFCDLIIYLKLRSARL
jgi:hypothetical protein